MSQVVFSIPDMAGSESEPTIVAAIGGLPGVEGVHVDPTRKTVLLTFDNLAGDLETVWEALGNAGFPVTQASTL